MRKSKVPGLWPYLITIVGGCLLIAGVFLPWYWVNFYNGEELTLNALGWNSHPVKILPDLQLIVPPWTDGLEILLLGVFLTALTLFYYWSKYSFLKWILPLVSLLSVWQVFLGFDFDSHLATINFWDGQDTLASVTLKALPFILVVWAGSLFALLGSTWLFFRSLKNKPVNSDNNHRAI